MKKRLHLITTLVLLVGSSVLFAQDTIRSLVITEWRGDWPHNAYVELTNMSDAEVDLSEFTLGLFVSGNSFADQAPERYTRLKGTLPAKETYVIASYAEGSEDWITPVGMAKNHMSIINEADLLVYIEEDANRLAAAGLTLADDSISPGFYELLNANRGERATFLFHHPVADDSVLVDGVGLVFDPNDNSLVFDQFKDVAGIGNATEAHILVRKYSVKEGNPDWKATRGATPAESQWMAVPFETGWFNAYSGEYTLCGNHGIFEVDQNTVKAKEGIAIDVDHTAKTITIPWGVYRDTLRLTPGVQMDLGNGLAWQYALNSVSEDSIHAIAQSGDVMTFMAVGNELQTVDFTINVAQPTNDMNLVFPLRTTNSEGFYNEGQYYAITQGDPVIDSITGVAFATRVDTLLKRIEKAPDANWEIEWVDGNERPDLKDGDKLIVTAKEGSTKEYYISVEPFEPNSNASLSAITWPEIPEYLKDGNGWTGDTIPNFLPTGLIYEITVPFGVNTIPALVPHTQNTNATVVTKRATTLRGSLEDRTTTFTVYAEDDTTYKEYKILFKKEILSDWIQPFKADPFFSQVARHVKFTNFWTELYNPGNQEVDLSDYMLTFGRNGFSPSEAISYDPPFVDRYYKYVPGYKYSDDATVYENDQTLQEDLAVNTTLKPRSTWLFGQFADREARRMDYLEAITDFHLSPTVDNVWGIKYDGQTQVSTHTYRRWPLYIFKITNDSVKTGEKLPNDPNDFELIDVFGRFPNTEKLNYDPAGINGSDWKQGFSASRKDSVYKGNTESGGSFGTTPENSEWENIRWKGIYDPSTTNLGQWDWCAEGLGIHNTKPITVYMSTVSSLKYLVDDGFEGDLTIDGIEGGTTYNQFISNLIMADENQYLKVISFADGNEITGDNTLSMNDTLVVTSADSVNVTKYALDVNDPLDDNAVISSTTYDVVYDAANESISGMDYGVTIKTILENITVPETAILNVINSEGAIVPKKQLRADTVYIDTKVNDDIYFEVVAQNGTDKITYQLKPNSESSDAFVLSDLYEVDQNINFINYINNNTSVSTFISNIVPVSGASVVIRDKAGYERSIGRMAYDDILEVTSEDGAVTNVYYLGFKAELEQLSSDAFVVSDEYTIDQTEMEISDVPQFVTLTEFSNNITPANGASFVVTDDEGTELTSGDAEIKLGYKLVVTSENEMNTTTYFIDAATALTEQTGNIFKIYPNPADERLFIEGLQKGDVVSIINVLGVTIENIPFEKYNGSVSLNNMKPGLYFIKINSKLSDATFKLYKE